MRIVQNTRSTCTKRVAVVLMEKGVPFEFVPVTEMKTVEYKANMQPFGQIPVLEDDGYFLYESRAIGRYIAQKYAKEGTPNLIPTSGDLKEMGTFERPCRSRRPSSSLRNCWSPRPSLNRTLQFIIGLDPRVSQATRRYMGGTTNPEEVKSLTERLAGKMDAYEQILGKTKYLAGDHITLADLFHLPYADMVTNRLKSDVMTTRPNVARWLQDISSRPSWLAVKDGVESTA
ncbi:glutathione S-transferase [Mycena rosella]|uniref:glutathione transferase n=1 Tax=Mycena rosella TaxID=1033263 RepID=A0AAD7GW26_MYCRO|nr:glutathione S-transferase [Mycena rosella]